MTLKSIMPETWFRKEGVFRGRSFNVHTALRAQPSSTIWMSMMKQGPSSSTTNMVQSLTTGEQGEDEEEESDVTQDEICAMVEQF